MTMTLLCKFGDKGDGVALLQRRLVRAGYPLPITHVFDAATERSLMAAQSVFGLVVDGIAGPKTFAALAGIVPPHYLGAADLERAAAALGVSLAAVRAVNEVESRGHGFLPDGRPVILFERHVFWKRLEAHGIDPAPLAVRYPSLVSTTSGGYQGDGAEYMRLATALTIHRAAAQESCSWGAFQIMGYHWEALEYASIEDFVGRMKLSEAEHLDGFVRFVRADKRLVTALKHRKWSTFARLYNGPAYARNLYDAKLAQAFAKYNALDMVAA
jgi:hypothetical protein